MLLRCFAGATAIRFHLAIKLYESDVVPFPKETTLEYLTRRYNSRRTAVYGARELRAFRFIWIRFDGVVQAGPGPQGWDPTPTREKSTHYTRRRRSCPILL